jgi:hypothetical protein
MTALQIALQWQYANIIGNEIVAEWCPMAWGAFKEHRLMK